MAHWFQNICCRVLYNTTSLRQTGSSEVQQIRFWLCLYFRTHQLQIQCASVEAWTPNFSRYKTSGSGACRNSICLRSFIFKTHPKEMLRACFLAEKSSGLTEKQLKTPVEGLSWHCSQEFRTIRVSQYSRLV